MPLAHHLLQGLGTDTVRQGAVHGEVGTLMAPGGVLLYLDEIQYFNKKQQQSLLEFMENGSITLIASTTENPYFYVYAALLSRSTVFELKPVTAADVGRGSGPDSGGPRPDRCPGGTSSGRRPCRTWRRPPGHTAWRCAGSPAGRPTG